MSLFFDKIFFGKDNALKVQCSLTDKKEGFYLQFGIKGPGEVWLWKILKFNELEVAEIVNVINGLQEKASFFHDFNGNKTSIHVNKSEKWLSIKAGDSSKSLNLAEQTILRILLERGIIELNKKVTASTWERLTKPLVNTKKIILEKDVNDLVHEIRNE